MKHMKKIEAAAKAAAKLTGDMSASWKVEYEESLGYRIHVGWLGPNQALSINQNKSMGMLLVVSEARAGSDLYLHQYIVGCLQEMLEDGKTK